jgi:membrane protein
MKKSKTDDISIEVEIRSKLSKLKDRIKILLDELYIGEKTYNTITLKLLNAIKVFIVSTRKFIIDDCLTKASSIAYTTIISLIPTLTVALTFYSIFSGVGDKKEELFRRITLFMLEHNIKLNIDPILEAISSLIENAGKIGGVGAVIMIFTATAVLRTLEKSLNDIWQVKKRRPIFLKIIFYWAALTLGPIMLIAGTTVATQVTTIFSSPNYKSAYISEDNKLWVVGNKSQILYSSKSDLTFYKITRYHVDFDNQRIMRYNPSKKEFEEHEFRIEELDFEKSTFNDVQFIGDRGWIVGDDGIILYSVDGGKTWLLNKWGTFRLNDIHMQNARRGFIAADNGNLLYTEDGGKNWSVIEWPDMLSNLNSIDFFGNEGIITVDRGTIISTNDGGKNWEVRVLDEARKRKRYLNLNDVYFVDKNNIWITGDEGIMLTSTDGGKKWSVKKFLENNYYSAFFLNRRTGIISGEKGNLLLTDDGGEKWHRSKLPTSRINRVFYQNGTIWAFGDRGMIMRSEDRGKSWQGLEGRSFVIYLLNFFAPFAFIWLLFLLTYILLPNIKIPLKPASIGAAFTGTVWVIFILLFIVYVKAFAKGTFAIYGALASIPIFLLMVYASSLIVLYGAEVSYTLMNPHTYVKLVKSKKDRKFIHVFYGISILYQIYKKFEDGKGSTVYRELTAAMSTQSDEIDYLIDLFLQERLISKNEEQNFVPANSSKHIVLSDVIDMIHDISLDIPGIATKSGGLRKYMNRIFLEMKRSRKRIIGDMTLYQLLNEIQ